MDRLLKIAEVQELTGLSRSTIYKKIAEGVLPAPNRLSRRCSRWRDSELQAAIEALPHSAEPCHKAGAKSDRLGASALGTHRNPDRAIT